jgi:branched-subunit amino acid transport protein
MSIWPPLVLAAAGSYLLRLLPLLLLDRIPAPAWLDRAGTLVAPVAFAAMAASAVAGGARTPADTAARLVAVVAAAVVAYRSRSTAATLVTGMAVLWLASAILGP